MISELQDLVKHPTLIAIYVALTATQLYLFYKQTQTEQSTILYQIQHETLQKLQERMEAQNLRSNQLEQDLLTLQAKNLQLHWTLEQCVSSENSLRNVLSSFITSSPNPSWVKQVIREPNGITFIMYSLNPKYMRLFLPNKGMGYYIGKTDFQVWPEATAQEFYLDDIAILDNKGANTFIELTGKCKVYKWYFQLTSGEEFIAGSIPLEDKFNASCTPGQD